MRLKPLLQALTIAATLCISTPSQAQTELKLPDLGTSALQVLPLEKEQALGEVMMMQLRARSPIVGDPVLEEYLTSLGNRLVANANDVRFRFAFGLTTKTSTPLRFMGAMLACTPAFWPSQTTKSTLLTQY